MAIPRISLAPWLARAILEATLIVFAVVLGFIANEWRGDVEAREQAQVALTRIADEMQANVDELEPARDYHRTVADSLRETVAQMDSGEMSTQGVLLDTMMTSITRGVSPPGLSDIAWEYATSRGELDVVPYETIADIAQVYSWQEAGVETTWRTIAEIFFRSADSLRERDIRADLLFMALAFDELASQEDYLVYLSREAILVVRAAAAD
jgi:hypothetical protein